MLIADSILLADTMNFDGLSHTVVNPGDKSLVSLYPATPITTDGPRVEIRRAPAYLLRRGVGRFSGGQAPPPAPYTNHLRVVCASPVITNGQLVLVD